jgi:Zn-finger in ubiquitin-hydrolases and other protein
VAQSGAVAEPDEINDRPLGLFRRLRRAGGAPRSPRLCAHLDEPVPDLERRSEGCEDHKPEDGSWVHLRQCLTCGYIGCCDSSRPRHATAHYLATGHPVMRSIEPGESWRWCYVDELLG